MNATRLIASTCLALALIQIPAQAGPCPCNGNTDGVGVVTMSDLDVISTCIDGDCTNCDNSCDVNCDGVIDLEDLSATECQVGTNDPTCCSTISTGACCIDGIECFQATQVVCMGIEDGRFLGEGTTCVADGCDCNGNGVADRLDIANNTDDDCNRNGVPDRCEINAGSPAPGGPFFCNLPGSCDPDCNNNGRPDECDIERCGSGEPDNPQCQDCNLNQIPDICDISMGTSNDSNGDFIPDECIFWDGEGGNDFWGNPQNWNPDGLPQPDSLVTIAGPTSIVQLDIPAQVQSLRLINQASLTVSSSDIFANLEVFNGLHVRGNLRLGQERFIIVMNGDAVVGSGGSIRRADPAPGLTSMLRVENGNLHLLEGIAGQPRGTLVFEEMMQLFVGGDFIVNGRNAIACDAIPFAGPDCTPPLIELTKEAQANLTGKMVMKGSVELKVGKPVASSATGPSGSAGPSAAGPPVTDHQIILGGDFKNNATDPQCFDFIDGGIRLDTNLTTFAATGQGIPQDFEVAGVDIGPVNAGFDNNFAIGLVTIDTPTHVNFVDRFDNVGGGQTQREAQYIQCLVLNDGTQTNPVGVNVYHGKLINKGSDIIGNGSIIPVGPDIPAASGLTLFIFASCMALVAARMARKQRFKPQT